VVTLVKLIVQAVVLTVDWLPASVWVMSFAQHDQPLGAVVPGVITSVLAPVDPPQLTCPAHAPPFCTESEAHAPVPLSVA